jgi:hypothetical protein
MGRRDVQVSQNGIVGTRTSDRPTVSICTRRRQQQKTLGAVPSLPAICDICDLLLSSPSGTGPTREGRRVCGCVLRWSDIAKQEQTTRKSANSRGPPPSLPSKGRPRQRDNQSLTANELCVSVGARSLPSGTMKTRGGSTLRADRTALPAQSAQQATGVRYEDACNARHDARHTRKKGREGEPADTCRSEANCWSDRYFRASSFS